MNKQLDWSGILYTGSYGEAGQYTIHVCKLNRESGKLEKIQQLDGASNASFLALHPDGGRLYAVKELSEHNGMPGGALISIPVDPATGLLGTIEEAVSTHGAHPCYVSVSSDGSAAFSANYSGGNVAVHPLDAEGKLGNGERTAHYRHQGQLGPKADRQEGPHAHCILPLEGTPFVYAADLGIDAVIVYRYDRANGVLEEIGQCRLHDGAGPRHIAFHPMLPVAYVTGELDSTVTLLDVDRSSGQLTARQTISTIPADYTGYNDSADLHLSPDGKFLYTSNRGHNSIAVFDVNMETGELVSAGHKSSGGEQPRNFGITPDGRYLLSANQKSGNIAVFSVDRSTGLLTDTGFGLELRSPVNITFGV